MATTAAQYAIDIAASMSGGEQTNAQLDALTASFMGAGKGAAVFQDAVQMVSDELSAAKRASEAAAEALAAGNEEFRALEKGAKEALTAYERAVKKGTDPGRITALGAKLGAAQSALEAHVGSLRALEGNASAAAAKEQQLANALSNVRKMGAHVDKTLSANSERLAKMQGALGQIGGPLGRLGQLVLAPAKGFADLSQTVGASRAALLAVSVAAVAAVAVVVALTAAVVAGVAAFAAWSVRLADNARNTKLATEAYEAANPAITALRGTITGLEDETGLSAQALRTLAVRLNDAKVSAEDMPAALRAAALAEAALGQGDAAKFVDDIKAGKLAVKEFASTAQQQFGDIVARQMMGLDRQSERLNKNLDALFGGLNIDSVLGGMQTLVGLFDKSSASGQALQTMFGSVFQPLIDNAQNAAYLIEAFVLGFEIGLMRVYLAAKPAIKFVAELFGFDDTSLEDTCEAVASVAEKMAIAFAIGAAVFGTVATAIAVVLGALVGLQVAIVAAVAAVAVFGAQIVSAFVDMVTNAIDYFRNASWEQLGYDAVMAIVGGLISVVGAVVNAGAAVVGAVTSAITNAVAFVRSINWAELGTNIVMGIAQGISSAAGAVIRAITGVASGAISAAKRVLGIASPSKVFAELGGYTGEGMVVGLEGQEAAVDQAMTRLAEPPQTALDMQPSFSQSVRDATSAPATSAPATSAPANRGIGSGNTFNFYGVQGAKDAVQRFEELLTKALEGDAAELGGEAAPA